MKVLTKEWTKIFKEVGEQLTKGQSNEGMKEKIAWLEEKAKQVNENNERVMPSIGDFAEKNCRIYQKGTSVILEVDEKSAILVENATIVENEGNIFTQSDVLLKAVEIYSLGENERELHTLLGCAGEEYYFTLFGKIKQAV